MLERRKVIMSGALLIGGMLVCIPTNDTVLKHNKDWKLMDYISQKYNVEHKEVEKILKIVDPKLNKPFPSRIDVLSIIAIESRFNKHAFSAKGARGWMQILYKKVHTEEENILAGIELLEDYHQKLGSQKATIQAYNVGITNYRKGSRNEKYYNKFIKTKEELSNYEC